jgi:hypothetical protein
MPTTAEKLDPVALAVANAVEDERVPTEEELLALREARADNRPLLSGQQVSVTLAERSRREE